MQTPRKMPGKRLFDDRLGGKIMENPGNSMANAQVWRQTPTVLTRRVSQVFSRRKPGIQAFAWKTPRKRVGRCFPGIPLVKTCLPGCGYFPENFRSGSHEIRQRFFTARKTAKICASRFTSINLIFPSALTVLCHLGFPDDFPCVCIGDVIPGKYLENTWCLPGVFQESGLFSPGHAQVFTRKTPGNTW